MVTNNAHRSKLDCLFYYLLVNICLHNKYNLSKFCKVKTFKKIKKQLNDHVNDDVFLLVGVPGNKTKDFYWTKPFIQYNNVESFQDLSNFRIHFTWKMLHRFLKSVGNVVFCKCDVLVTLLVVLVHGAHLGSAVMANVTLKYRNTIFKNRQNLKVAPKWWVSITFAVAYDSFFSYDFIKFELTLYLKRFDLKMDGHFVTHQVTFESKNLKNTNFLNV